jgi:hypothetical protein
MVEPVLAALADDILRVVVIAIDAIMQSLLTCSPIFIQATLDSLAD